MTTLPEIVVVLLLSGGIWWLYFIEYKRLALDTTRQRLFSIRDRLFEQAAQGHLDFDSHAYGMVRTTLNGMIQYAHNLSFFKLLLTRKIPARFGHDKNAEKFSDNLKAAISALPPASRRPILAALNDMHAAMLLHMVFNAPILLGIYLPANALFRRTKTWKRMMRNAITTESSRRSLYALDAAATATEAHALHDC